jgi:hypothetical protein
VHFFSADVHFDQNQNGASFEQVFWRAEKNTRIILKSQTPLSYPSQNKTAQSDVSAKTALKSAQKKTCEFQNKITLLCARR